MSASAYDSRDERNRPGEQIIARKRTCVVYDNRLDSLDDIIPVVQRAGYEVIECDALAQFAEVLFGFFENTAVPDLILLDVHIDDIKDLAPFGRPGDTVPYANTAGIFLRQEILSEFPQIDAVPLIYISDHNDIAVMSASKERIEKKRNTFFISKERFSSVFDETIRDVYSSGEMSIEGLTASDYEQVWHALSDFLGIDEDGAVSALGYDSRPGVDILTLMYNRDTRNRVDMLLDIATDISVITELGADKDRILNSSDLIGSKNSIKTIIVGGQFKDIQRLRAELKSRMGV